MIGLTLVTPPAAEPATLAQAKAFCRVDSSFTLDDTLITSLIAAGRFEAEAYTHRAIFNQQWRLSLDRFPIFWMKSSVKSIEDSYYPYQYFFEGLNILLPKPQCVTVDSITYVDTAGVTQTLDSSGYFVDTDSEPARIIPTPGAFWPTMQIYKPGSVKITYTCGSYGDGVRVNTCPANVTTAVCVYVAHFYANREGNLPIPDAFYRLLDPVKFDTFCLSFY